MLMVIVGNCAFQFWYYQISTNVKTNPHGDEVWNFES